MEPIASLFAAVSPVLNATIACQESTSSFFRTVTLILSQNCYQTFVIISKNHSYFSRHRNVASWLIEYWHTGTGNFEFSVLILKYLIIKNYSANFVENCQIYFKELLVNVINRIINSDKFSRSYDNLYL